MPVTKADPTSRRYAFTDPGDQPDTCSSAREPGDSMQTSRWPGSAGPARGPLTHIPDRAPAASRAARPGQESGRTARYRRTTSLPVVGVPGFARRSLMSIGSDSATVIRTLAIAWLNGARKPRGGSDLIGT
jgi:hypothetical protein